MPTTADVLRAARDVYARAPSHAPLGSCPRGGTHCMVTATGYAAISLGEGLAEANAADEALMRVLGIGGSDDDLIAWNAEHDTATALAVFGAAIEASR